jgi:hypothetical protein
MRRAASPEAAPRRRLHRDADRHSDVGIPAVVKVIAIVDVGDVNVVVVIPVIAPVFGPRVNETDPIALILEARVPTNDQEGQTIDAEPMVATKVSAVAVVRNAVTVVAATLSPVAVIRVPALRAMLLPGAPLDALLFLAALRMFVAALLLGVLLPIVLALALLLLSVLLSIVLVLPLLLLCVLFWILPVLPLLLLGVLLPIVLVLPLLLLSMLRLSVLLCGFGLLVPSLLLLGMGLLFALLLVLGINGSSDSEKQKQYGCAAYSNCVHMCYLCYF